MPEGYDLTRELGTPSAVARATASWVRPIKENERMIRRILLAAAVMSLAAGCSKKADDKAPAAESAGTPADPAEAKPMAEPVAPAAEVKAAAADDEGEGEGEADEADVGDEDVGDDEEEVEEEEEASE